MGRDKALLPYAGTTLAGYLAPIIERVCGSVTLVGPEERYGSLGFAVLADDEPGAGPLGGILTALRRSPARWTLVAACDMPGLTESFLETLFAEAEASEAQCVLPVSEAGSEPLCAVYRDDCVPALSAAYVAGVRKMTEALAALDLMHWRVPPIAGNGRWSENLNTAEEWQRHLGSIGGGGG